MVIPGNGKLEMVYTPDGGAEERIQVFQFKNGGGVGLTMYNTDEVRGSNLVHKYAVFSLTVGHSAKLNFEKVKKKIAPFLDFLFRNSSYVLSMF